MHFPSIVTASLVAPLVAAHGGIEGAPRIFGMPKQLRASNPFAGYQARHAAPSVEARQSDPDPDRCGPEGGNQICAAEKCCSGAGYCGTTQEHCQAPDCLFNFGPGCDANKTPAGASTRNDDRRQLGSIPYGGAGIYVCDRPGTVAITYDDGPYIYTEDVMAQFEARGAHATFFITGNNIGKGAIDEKWAGVIKKMYDNGHQVASHTWSHQDLSLITEEQVYDQMIKNEMALRNIIGKYPTYMRPPYSSCNGVCQNVLQKLGYVVSYFDLDTSDYLNLTPEKIQVAKDKFKDGIDTRNIDPYDGDRLVIGHDIHQLTAENLTAYMLDYVYDQGLTAVTMGDCLNDPKENWYRDSMPAPPSTSSTRSSSAPVATPTGPTSADGSCGSAANGQSCIGFVGVDGLMGECCSQYGWCGRTLDHCQTGCQAGFGKCGAQPSASSSASASATISESASAPVSASATGPVPTPTGPTTTDGTCGAGSGGMSCIGFTLDGAKAECCSEYGYCGNTDVYCAAGCQAGFGKCGGAQDVGSSSAAVSAATSSVAAGTSQPASSSALISPSASVVASSSVAPSPVVSSLVVVSSSASPASSASSSVAASSSAATSSSVAVSSISEKVDAASSVAPTPSPDAASSPSLFVSISASVSASASASVSEKSEQTESTSAAVSASSTGGYPVGSETPVSVSKDSYPTESASSDLPSFTLVSTLSQSEVYTANSSVIQASSTVASSAILSSASESKTVYPASSTTPAPVYASSSFSTAVVKASSTPHSTSSATPSPTALAVSKNGLCGSTNGGQTCAGYKSPWGIQMGCCCKQSGRCSVDPWACGLGCDKGYGKCWF